MADNFGGVLRCYRVAHMYEVVRPLAALKKTLGQTRMGIALEVDDNGFARADLWPFAATSGRKPAQLPGGQYREPLRRPT